MPASLATAEPPATACATATAAATGPRKAFAEGRTRSRKVFAFVHDCEIDRNADHLRDVLAREHTELTLVTDRGVWSFDGDDAFSADRVCGDAAGTALLLGARTLGDTLFVIERGARGARIDRYPVTRTAPLSVLLERALTPRPENV